MSNRTGIADIANRLEHDIYNYTNQELNWQARVMINNFREQLRVLEGNMDLGPLTIISILNRYLDEEEKELDANSINE